MNNDLQAILHRIDTFIVVNFATFVHLWRHVKETHADTYYMIQALQAIANAHGFRLGGTYGEPFGFDIYDLAEDNKDEPEVMFRLAVIDGRIHVQQYVKDQYGGYSSDFN